MVNETSESTVVRDLAERVVSDIRLRRMIHGEQYLTGDEARRAFGVGKGVMNRAMRLLSERGVLVRRQNVGTFVGPTAPVREDVKARTVCSFYSSRMSYLSFDSLVEALHKELPGANVHFNLVGGNEGIRYVKELLASARATSQFGGVVAIGCSYEVVRYLIEADVPLVGFGPMYLDYWDGQSVPWLDMDRRQAGRLLTRYLVDRGHRRLALLDGPIGRMSDNRFYDGVSEVLTEAGLPHNSLLDRLLPGDIDVVPVLTRRLLELPNHPTAFMASSERIADSVASTVCELGLTVGRDIEVSFWEQQPRRSIYPYVRLRMTFDEITAELARMFKGVCEGKPREKEVTLIPVELCTPEDSGPAASRVDVTVSVNS